LLYPEDSTHVEALEKIKAYEYALILHDKDLDKDGNVKKPHYHVVLSLKNAQWCTAIAKELGITPNYIQQIRNEESALEYLIHFNDDSKHQYTVDDVKGSMQRKLVQYINKSDVSEGDKVGLMIEYIQSFGTKISITNFSKYCSQNGYWDVFRRSGTIFIKIIEEHNQHVYDVECEKKYVDNIKNS
jgi:hypothetical protein